MVRMTMDLQTRDDVVPVIDILRINQIFFNLFSNAVKYTPEGGTVRVYGDCGTLTIADTGIGIRPEDLPRVFEKGFTGYNGREDNKATGIGLYLCRRVLERLGHAEARRLPGCGLS